MWRGCGGNWGGLSGSNNLIKKLNGEIFDVGGENYIKHHTIASVFADFAAWGGQYWPLNVSVGWGERMSSRERRQHNN